MYKPRKIGHSKTSGDVYGITVPRNIYVQFSGCQLSIQTSGNQIIYEAVKIDEDTNAE